MVFKWEGTRSMFHIQPADDTLIPMDGEEEKIGVIKSLIKCFCACFGLQDELGQKSTFDHWFF